MMRHALLALVTMGLLACSGAPKQDDAPAQPAPAAEPTPPVAAPLPPPPAEPTAEEVPLPEDFADEAANEITSKTYKSELDTLAKQIDAESAR